MPTVNHIKSKVILHNGIYWLANIIQFNPIIGLLFFNITLQTKFNLKIHKDPDNTSRTETKTRTGYVGWVSILRNSCSYIAYVSPDRLMWPWPSEKDNKQMDWPFSYLGSHLWASTIQFVGVFFSVQYIELWIYKTLDIAHIKPISMPLLSLTNALQMLLSFNRSADAAAPENKICHPHCTYEHRERLIQIDCV